MPCNNLPIMYGLADKSVFEIMLKTCNITDIPPNPNKKDVKTKLIRLLFVIIHEIIFIPLVISNIPVNRPLITEVSILK